MRYPVVNPYARVLERAMKHAGTNDPKKIEEHFETDEAKERMEGSRKPENPQKAPVEEATEAPRSTPYMNIKRKYPGPLEEEVQPPVEYTPMNRPPDEKRLVSSSPSLMRKIKNRR